MQWAWFGHVPTVIDIVSDMLFAVPLSIIFCVIAYMTMSAEAISSKPEVRTEGMTQPARPAYAVTLPEPAPIMRRLKPENRGQLLHLSVEDHYTMVTTNRGRELILLRFSDAVSETGTTAGLQVHRSHWVADVFVKSVNRANGKLTLLLSDGAEIPVSRTYAAEVRTRFG
jgi:DNA-binding LytR/AlgR family response regulator